MRRWHYTFTLKWYHFMGANNFNSEFGTAWFVHDAFLPLLTALINTLAILPLIDWSPKKNSD
jgi:hypothetical protein